MTERPLSDRQLIALEVVLFVVLVAAYFVGLWLGAEPLDSWWRDAQRVLGRI